MGLFPRELIAAVSTQIVPTAQALMGGPGTTAVGGKIVGQRLTKEGMTTPRPSETPLTNPQSPPTAPLSTLQTAATGAGSGKIFEGKIFGLPAPLVLIGGGLLAYKFLIA